MESETPVADAPKVNPNAVQSGIPLGSVIWVVGFIAFAWWQFGPSIHLTSNKLEKALVLGASTRPDFQVFQDAGGLDGQSTSQWHSYTVTSARTEYDSSGKLSGYVLGINKNDGLGKLASFENVKSSVSGTCGRDWIIDGDMHKTNNGKVMCSYLDQQNGTVEVIVTET